MSKRLQERKESKKREREREKIKRELVGIVMIM